MSACGPTPNTALDVAAHVSVCRRLDLILTFALFFPHAPTHPHTQTHTQELQESPHTRLSFSVIQRRHCSGLEVPSLHCIGVAPERRTDLAKTYTHTRLRHFLLLSSSKTAHQQLLKFSLVCCGGPRHLPVVGRTGNAPLIPPSFPHCVPFSIPHLFRLCGWPVDAPAPRLASPIPLLPPIPPPAVQFTSFTDYCVRVCVCVEYCLLHRPSPLSPTPARVRTARPAAVPPHLVRRLAVRLSLVSAVATDLCALLFA